LPPVLGAGVVRLIQLFLLVAATGPAFSQELKTENVILVTLDGVRTEEIFGGLQDDIANQSAKQVYSEIEYSRERYDAETAAERRALLMPFFWGELAAGGMLFGNTSRDSHMLVENPVKWSSPGYAEMLTGGPQVDVKDNSFVRYPHVTVLEFVADTLQLDQSQVAQIGSWSGFPYLAARSPDVFVMNGGYDAFPAAFSSPAIDELVTLRRDVMELWEESSNDGMTYRIARTYLFEHRPRLMWLGLTQSDDWAHADRYDRLLDYLHLADSWLRDLWTSLQADSHYRNRTTLIITTDHGRGRTPADWAEHDQTIPGSESVWLAIIGPDTPAMGDRVPPGSVHQGAVAATILRLFGLDPEALSPAVRPALPGVIDTAATAGAGQ
jgi:hypothetical protein